MTILFGPNTHLIQSSSAKLLNCCTAMQHLLDNTCLTTAALLSVCVFTSISSLNESVKPQFKEPVEAQVGLPCRCPVLNRTVQYFGFLSILKMIVIPRGVHPLSL